MKVAMDIETDSLDATRIWCVCSEDVDTGEQRFWSHVAHIEEERESFIDYCKSVDTFVFHNGLQFDVPTINRLLGTVVVPPEKVIDTLVLSRLDNYSREAGHSLRSWGDEFRFPKGDHSDFSQLTQEMLDYCKQDVSITVRLYKRLIGRWSETEASRVEHSIQHLCQVMHENGFHFDKGKAEEYLNEIENRMKTLERMFNIAFPPKLEVTNSLKYRVKADGSLFSNVEKAKRKYYKTEVKDDLLYCYDWVYFNPGSPKDRIDRLWEAEWKPVDKTKGHIAWEKTQEEDKRDRFTRYGWICNETNLNTLPPDAPEGAQSLAEWLVLEGRRSSLVEWLGCVESDSRIHGRFQHIGAWTGRLSHSKPNQANIPSAFHGEPKTAVEKVKSRYDGAFRSLFSVPDDRYYLVGTDAEGIQLRILAHLMKSQDYVDAICTGRKENETDIHNLNRKALGLEHVTRDMAKTFIYAFLLGAGVGKVSQILKTNTKIASDSIENFLDTISGLRYLKETEIPKHAQAGYFIGLDGRRVPVPSLHKTLAGMLQSGESTIMKHATLIWTKQLDDLGISYKLVTWPHDEWQTEVMGSREDAETVGRVQREAIEEAGRRLNLFCPLAGSTDIGRNWADTH